MSEPLVIWLPEDLDDAWAYYRSHDVQGWAADDDERRALSKLDGSGCHVICPGTWFRVFPHALPEMKMSERLSAAGFAIEEKLAAPLDEQHIVLGEGLEQKVGVVNRALMDQVIERLDACGLTPTLLAAEYEAFSSDSGVQHAWNRTIHPGSMGYSLDAEMEGENPLSLVPQMVTDDALNYAQGDYSRRRSNGFGTQNLIALAATVALAFVTWIGWQWSDARAMNAQATDLRAEAASLYTEATGRKPGPNFRRTVERKVKSGGETTSDFVTLTALFFEGIKGVDQVYVDSLRYNEARGALIVKMVYPGFDSANKLESVFAGSEVTFKPGTVRDQKGLLIGEGEFTMGASR